MMPKTLKVMFMALVMGVALALTPVQADEKKGDAPVTLVKLWETEKGLLVPESVLYDKNGNILYVSSINGTPTEKNGKGFVSKVSLDGKILDLKWATGLDAPKGSAIYKGKFYVSDIDRLVEFDLKTGAFKAAYPAKGARFLNDVAADRDGNIYVTDMDKTNSAIYRLTGGVMEVWFKGPDISEPNGLHMEANKLMVGNGGDGKIKAIRLADKSVSIFATAGSNIDGLRPDGKGNYFISNWKGKTSLAMASGECRVLMDTTADQINSADLEYVVDRHLLLIPTFFHNTVAAYNVK
jgi:sugar lactone lactonase YvrE